MCANRGFLYNIGKVAGHQMEFLVWLAISFLSTQSIQIRCDFLACFTCLHPNIDAIRQIQALKNTQHTPRFRKPANVRAESAKTYKMLKNTFRLHGQVLTPQMNKRETTFSSPSQKSSSCKKKHPSPGAPYIVTQSLPHPATTDVQSGGRVAAVELTEKLLRTRCAYRLHPTGRTFLSAKQTVA